MACLIVLYLLPRLKNYEDISTEFIVLLFLKFQYMSLKSKYACPAAAPVPCSGGGDLSTGSILCIL